MFVSWQKFLPYDLLANDFPLVTYSYPYNFYALMIPIMDYGAVETTPMIMKQGAHNLSSSERRGIKVVIIML